MSNFSNFLNKIIGDKKEWKKMETRAKALPSDYRMVYHEIKKYMWKSAGSEMDTIAILEDLLGLFEEGAADGKRVLEIIGDDVAAFCDELLKVRNVKMHKTYMEKWHEELNRDVMKKLGNEEKK